MKFFVLAVLLILMVRYSYVNVAPNKALIITGITSKPRVIIGRGAFIIPFFERIDELDLSAFIVPVNTESYVPTKDNALVRCNSVVSLQIKISDEEALDNAIRNFINSDSEEYQKEIQESLKGDMREIISVLELSTLLGNRIEFAKQVQVHASAVMARFGLEIVSYNIKNIEVQNGLIESLARKKAAEVREEAAIAEAEAEKNIALAKAEAQEIACKRAVEAKIKIAEQNNLLILKEAQLQAEAGKAKAIAQEAFQIELSIQRQKVDLNYMETDIKRQESMIQLKKLETQTYKAEISGKAEADSYAAKQAIDVKTYEMTKVSEVEADAKKLMGQADANALLEKAKAMAEMNEISAMEIYLNSYAEIVRAAAEPMSQVKKITMYNSSGNPTQLVGEVINATSQIAEGLKESTGIDFKKVISCKKK